MNITHKDLLINGIRTPIKVCAPPGQSDSSEAVIFIHGNPGSSEDWKEFIPLVSKFSRTIAPDMPGYGKADRPKAFSYTIDGYADHLYALVDALDIKKIHLVLHDFGGAWGLQFAANNPHMIKSIVLVNIGILPGYKWHSYARIWRTPILGELFQLLATRWAFRLLLNRDNPLPLPKAFTDRMFEDSDWGLSKGMLKLYRSTASLADFTHDIAESLKGLDLPALILWGDGDKYMPVSFAKLQGNYFDAEVHHLPDCGHWPMIDNPKLVSSHLVPFLEAQYHRTTLS